MHRKMVTSARLGSGHYSHCEESFCCDSESVIILSPLDADRAILPVLSEEPAEFVWHASHCALHSAHQ